MGELYHRRKGYFQDRENFKPDVHWADLQTQVNSNSLAWFVVGGEQGLKPIFITQMKIGTWNFFVGRKVGNKSSGSRKKEEWENGNRFTAMH